MKNNRDYKYSEIASFEDFRIAREQLIFRSKLNETKLKLRYLQVKRMFSVSNLIISLTKDLVLPKISDLLGVLAKKAEKKAPLKKDKKKTRS